MERMKKLITMIAGPNGAGKTTTTSVLLTAEKELYDESLNADEIARGLAPLHPEGVSIEAGKLMIKRLRELLAANKSFTFETTASGTMHRAYLQEAHSKGYEINIMFLWLSSAEQAVERVANRVKMGGHNIPENVIKRRYYRGLKNLLHYYLPIADTALIIDNSAAKTNQIKVIAKKDLNDQLQVKDERIWEEIQRSANVEI